MRIWLLLLGVGCMHCASDVPKQMLEIKPGQADYDPYCDYLDAAPPKIKLREPANQKYYDKPIPRSIHQIWFGPQTSKYKDKITSWQKYAATFGYTYRLWTESDLDEIKALISSANFALMEAFTERKNWWAVSDILRLEILSKKGGVYSDVDVSPPSDTKGLLDLDAIVPMRGIILITETNGRTIGNSALFVCNNFIASSAGHPLTTYLANHFEDNIRTWQSQCDKSERACNDIAAYQTGPFYISKALTGVLTILPISFTHRLRMTDEDK